MLFLSIAFTILVHVTFAAAVPRQVQQQWPRSYIAFGDSYAAGIGAGKFYHGEDRSNKACKRFDGSYPAQLKSLPFLSSVPDPSFKFQACFGAVLDDLDGQLAQVSGQRADVVTLSISGNDFNFAGVVEACVYNIPSLFADEDQECDNALAIAEQKMRDGATWEKYKRKVTDIIANHLSVDVPATLLITGYARFFGPNPTANDYCASHGFPLLPLIYGPNLRPSVRARIDQGVTFINGKIQSDIIPLDSSIIQFIDIDSGYPMHRFCEPSATTVAQAIGEDDPNIWMNTLWEDYEEVEWVDVNDGGVQTTDSVWKRQLQGANDAQQNGTKRELRAMNALFELHQNSVFHPKPGAHAVTARKIEAALRNFARSRGL